MDWSPSLELLIVEVLELRQQRIPFHLFAPPGPPGRAASGRRCRPAAATWAVPGPAGVVPSIRVGLDTWSVTGSIARTGLPRGGRVLGASGVGGPLWWRRSGIGATHASPLRLVREAAGHGCMAGLCTGRGSGRAGAWLGVGSVYLQHCGVCHGANGEGQHGVFPSLARNPNLADTAKVLGTVLDGRPGTAMPPWRGRLSGEEIVAVVNYIRTSWGNDFGTVAPEDVAARR